MTHTEELTEAKPMSTHTGTLISQTPLSDMAAHFRDIVALLDSPGSGIQHRARMIQALLSKREQYRETLKAFDNIEPEESTPEPPTAEPEGIDVKNKLHSSNSAAMICSTGKMEPW